MASMDMVPEMSMEFAVLQLQEDVLELRNDMDRMQKFLDGGEDPTKGLLWLVADMGKVLTSLTNLVTELQKSLNDQSRTLTDHVRHPIVERRSDEGTFKRWMYDVSKAGAGSLLTFIVLAVLAWTVLGFRLSVNTPIQ